MKQVSEKAISQAARMMGRRGGLKTASTHGQEFYREIGRKGGSAKKQKRLHKEET